MSDKLTHNLSLQDTYLQGKGIALESEYVDVLALQCMVFELEQDSVVKDVWINDLETSNVEKDNNIMELQESLGGLTTLYFDLQQKLVKRYCREFKSYRNDDDAYM